MISLDEISGNFYRYDDGKITFRTIKEYYDNNTLDLDPDYQRDIVWNTEKQQLFIDSVMCGYCYPPVIFNLVNGIWRCMDGKQRITSILNFLHNRIHYDYNGEAILFDNLDNHSKQCFLSKSFINYEYKNLPEDIESEIFRRLQYGMIMKRPEIIKSYNTDLMNAIKEKTGGLSALLQYLNVKIERENHLHYFLRCLLLEYRTDKFFVTLTIDEVEKFVKNYIKNEEIELLFYDNLNKINIFLTLEKNKFKRQNSKPFTIFEFVLLYKLTQENILSTHSNKFIDLYHKYTKYPHLRPLQYIPKNFEESYNAMM